MGFFISKKIGGSPDRHKYSTINATLLLLSEPINAWPMPSRFASKRTIGRPSQSSAIESLLEARPRGASNTPAGFKSFKFTIFSISLSGPP